MLLRNKMIFFAIASSCLFFPIIPNLKSFARTVLPSSCLSWNAPRNSGQRGKNPPALTYKIQARNCGAPQGGQRRRVTKFHLNFWRCFTKFYLPKRKPCGSIGSRAVRCSKNAKHGLCTFTDTARAPHGDGNWQRPVFSMRAYATQPAPLTGTATFKTK